MVSVLNQYSAGGMLVALLIMRCYVSDFVTQYLFEQPAFPNILHNMISRSLTVIRKKAGNMIIFNCIALVGRNVLFINYFKTSILSRYFHCLHYSNLLKTLTTAPYWIPIRIFSLIYIESRTYSTRVVGTYMLNVLYKLIFYVPKLQELLMLKFQRVLDNVLS